MEWHTHSVVIELHILAPHKVHAWLINVKTYPDGKELILDTDFSDIELFKKLAIWFVFIENVEVAQA